MAKKSSNIYSDSVKKGTVCFRNVLFENNCVKGLFNGVFLFVGAYFVNVF